MYAVIFLRNTAYILNVETNYITLLRVLIFSNRICPYLVSSKLDHSGANFRWSRVNNGLVDSYNTILLPLCRPKQETIRLLFKGLYFEKNTSLNIITYVDLSSSAYKCPECYYIYIPGIFLYELPATPKKGNYQNYIKKIVLTFDYWNARHNIRIFSYLLVILFLYFVEFTQWGPLLLELS